MPLEKVASIEDIVVGAGIAVEIQGEAVALVRIADDVVKAIHNLCNHQYYERPPEGWFGPCSIECALHGSEFDLDTSVPAFLPALDPIPVYRRVIVDGDVLVDLDDQLNDAKPARY